MSKMLKSIDARTRLAGANKLEILMFRLGADIGSKRRETFGINVFKVREVMRVPQLTHAPEMPQAIEGMVSLRGVLVPVIDLVKYTGFDTAVKPEIMIVTEYNGHTQGFLVEAVETILRLDWSAMRVPPEMITNKAGGLITAVTELADGRLVMMMDVERILAETTGYDDNEQRYGGLTAINRPDRTVLFVDDSPVARRQITRTLEALHIGHIVAHNGAQAWQELQQIADQAEVASKPITEYIQAVLTDVEMPEMDGYMLTKLIKGDSRFSGIPVIMHSSLSGESNQQLGKSVGVDEYVPKFEPKRLADTLSRILA